MGVEYPNQERIVVPRWIADRIREYHEQVPEFLSVYDPDKDAALKRINDRAKEMKF